MRILLLLGVCVSWIAYCQATLTSRLRHYETLHSSHLSHHIHKRSVQTQHPTSRTVTIPAFGRQFTLHLQSERKVFSKTMTVTSVDNEHSKPFWLNTEEFYSGYVEGEPNSKVHCYWEHDNVVASIKTLQETFVIEPSWRHLPESDKYSMIAYRVSDVLKDKDEHPDKHAGGSVCGFVHPDYDEAAYTGPPPSRDENRDNKTPKDSSRHKRQSADLKVCSVALVADYRFFAEVGNSDVASTAKYLVGVLTRVNDVYQTTDWGNGDAKYQDLGFEIDQIVINTEATVGINGHYNQQADSWSDTKELLKAFSLQDWGNVCLAHLFTHLSFSDGVLGLAWIASDRTDSAGGMCSPKSGSYWYNTAWSSTLNKAGNRLLTVESDLVTTHEFGHNWGSQHDPDTTECAPGSSDGGSYVMYTYAVSGYDSNNNKFSSCSKATVLSVLANKLDSCFEERSGTFCGNYNVEDGEECDAGQEGKAGEDPCCDEDCKIKNPGVCSDVNSECCTNCQFAADTKVCRTAVGQQLCKENALCTGSSAECPASPNKANGNECIDKGECLDGECQAFCEKNGLISCVCSEVDDSCKYCCRSSADGLCTPYTDQGSGGNFNVEDGKSCVKGICTAGVCESSIRNLGNRLWDVIDDKNVNIAAVIMKNNIVLTIVFFSLLLWVPICIVVYCIDRRLDKEDDDDVDWHSRDNEALIRPGDEKMVRQTYTRFRKGPTKPKTPKELPPVRSKEVTKAESEASASKVMVVPM